MFGAKKPAANNVKKLTPVNNPFDSDDESDAATNCRRTSSEPIPANDLRYRNDFRDSGGIENQSVQDLENYAVHKSEETTNTVNNCLRIAEDMKQGATTTLEMLHAQGEQITRTHQMAVDIDKDLSKGEKLLNSLGGMFSKPWKPKKTKKITGPVITSEKASKRSEYHKEKKDLTGSQSQSHSHSQSQMPSSELAPMQKIEQEKAKQDDALSDLSNILGDLKTMAIDMGGEINRQNEALDHLNDDVEELNSRVKGANQRTRKLLGK